MDERETDLIRQVSNISAKFSDYEMPYLRSDGDIVIPLIIVFLDIKSFLKNK